MELTSNERDTLITALNVLVEAQSDLNDYTDIFKKLQDCTTIEEIKLIEDFTEFDLLTIRECLFMCKGKFTGMSDNEFLVIDKKIKQKVEAL